MVGFDHGSLSTHWFDFPELDSSSGGFDCIRRQTDFEVLDKKSCVGAEGVEVKGL